MITVNSRLFDGSLRRSWRCDVVREEGSLLVLVGEFDIDIHHPDLGHLRKGTVSYEYYWLDRWYNIFLFREPTGEFRNYYCNINMPPTFAEGVLDYVDLDIDIVVWPDRTYAILDREEYETNARRFGYPSEVKVNVQDALEELLELIAANRLPGADEAFETSTPERRENVRLSDSI